MILKRYADTICLAPNDRTATAPPITVNNKIKTIWRWTAKFQLGAGFREIINGALGGITVGPEGSAGFEKFPSWRTPAVWNSPSIVNLG
ncbi:MAG: hypothetical protein WA177_06410 [Xanthobacteraceae bacterium]